MVNVISSAITNAPPPGAVARLLHRRTRVHLFDRRTREDLVPLFRAGVDGAPRRASTTMPARNYVVLTVRDGADVGVAGDGEGGALEGDGAARPYALEVAFRVEVDPKDREGRTKGYGFSIPALEV